jgi:predicted amidohydrolase YtcJ
MSDGGGSALATRRGIAAVVLAATTCLGIAALRSNADAPAAAGGAVYYVHGHIYTNDPQHPWAEAMEIRDDKIVCVGSIAACATNTTGGEVVDLQSHFVMPGFNDAHVHLGSGGANLLNVQLNGLRSIREVQEKLRADAKTKKSGEWIIGEGWDHTLWPEKKFPNRQQLDAAVAQNPVFLVHVSGHVAVANSLALKLAGIAKGTPNPSGGEIERDDTGEPTGMLKEGSAMALVHSKIPPLSHERRRQGIELALADIAKNGVTSIQDNSGWEDFQVYQELKKEGKLTARITEWLPFTAPLDKLEAMRREGGTTDPWLKTGALKMVTDGALGSRTAAMLAPYSDESSTSGILIMEADKLRQLAVERDKAGFQLNFHAIGDRANRVSLDVFEAVAKTNGERDRRDRIEHAQVVAVDDIPRFAKLNVIASMQPSHETTDGRWAESRVGADRIKGAYAWASMEKAGVRLAFGTDYPVEPISPMRGLFACVSREVPGGPSGGWHAEEKISLEDCIRAYTSGSAYGEFEEGKKGELKAGEYADFIVLSNDLTKVRPADYLKTQVLRAVVDGRTVYQAH